ncbi:MAG: F0F1 ATP synthase subunit delta [Rickettsiella sp.]|nr:F0F1 ATP synthase subunit delta [Rickettsiella sp.]
MNWTSIARPYAKAAFEIAIKGKQLDAWSVLLDQTALIVKEEPMQILLKDLRLDKMVAYECLLLACESMIFTAGKNFLKLIALHQRLLVLPEISRLFANYKAKQANQVTVKAISAVSLTKPEGQALTMALERRLQREIKLDYTVDDYFLGGLVIRVGDLVIDGSVRGKLERLRAKLVN